MLALHTWTLDTTPLAEVLRVARRVGWDGIELRRADFARAAERGQSAADVLALVSADGLPVACVGVEFGWMYAEGAERLRLLRVFDEQCGRAADDVRGDELVYVQFSDVPASVESGKVTDRLPPGRGVVPIKEFFALVDAKGYRGFMSYEAPNPAAWARPADDVAREALEATRAVQPR